MSTFFATGPAGGHTNNFTKPGNFTKTGNYTKPGNNTKGLGGAWGGGGSDASRIKAEAARHTQDELASEHFAWGVAGFIALFIAAHWIRKAYKKGTKASDVLRVAAYPIVSITRVFRNVVVRPLPGFTSTGHAATILAYTAMNAAIAFTHVDITNYSNLADRFGWMTTLNLAVLCFLALKNTPLGFLIGYSYERLNVLHQACGYTTVMFMALHGIMYAVYFMSIGTPSMLRRPSDVAGIVAGFGMFVMLVMPILLKGKRYEVFYASHITSFVLIIITAALHQKDFATRVVIMTILAGGMWASDRILRALRIGVNAFGNYAKLYPLPNGGTHVVVRRGPRRSIPGQHCFLWIPEARRFETHPFSIVTCHPTLEFVVNARDGFTRDLHKLALAKPDQEVLCSVDGGYGTFPDPLTFDRVLLIAGGNGASFAFGVLGSLLGRMSNDHKIAMEFTWTVRERAQLSWYQTHLDAIKRHAHYSKLSLTLHVTRETAPKAKPSEISPVTFSQDVEKELEKTISSPPSQEYFTVENGIQTVTQDSQRTQYGRLDVKEMINQAVERASPNQRVLVAACGPSSLMRDVRRAVGSSIQPNGAGVELHCEQFGW